MFTGIAQEIGDWASHLVFSPVVWLGVVLAGISVVLIVASGRLRARQVGPAADSRQGAARSGTRSQGPSGRGRR